MTQIPVQKYFNTGYLSQDLITKMRTDQGLMSQEICNGCLNVPRITLPQDYNAQLVKMGIGTGVKPVNPMYPAQQTPLPTYGFPPLPTGVGCTRYVAPA